MRNAARPIMANPRKAAVVPLSGVETNVSGAVPKENVAPEIVVSAVKSPAIVNVTGPVSR